MKNKICSPVASSVSLIMLTAEPEEESPVPTGRGGGGAHDAQGRHVTYEFFF